MAQLLLDNINYPFRASVVMHFVSIQLLNAFEWFRVLGQAELVDNGWKGFVHFKRAAHRAIPHTEFLLKVAYDANLHWVCTGGGVTPGVTAAAAGVTPAECAPAAAGGTAAVVARQLAGPMPPPQRGREMPARRLYYEVSQAEVATALHEHSRTGWKMRFFFGASRNANIVRCVAVVPPAEARDAMRLTLVGVHVGLCAGCTAITTGSESRASTALDARCALNG